MVYAISYFRTFNRYEKGEKHENRTVKNIGKFNGSRYLRRKGRPRICPPGDESGDWKKNPEKFQKGSEPPGGKQTPDAVINVKGQGK
nr:hypothetical protein [Desulfobacula sp.]